MKRIKIIKITKIIKRIKKINKMVLSAWVEILLRGQHAKGGGSWPCSCCPQGGIMAALVSLCCTESRNHAWLGLEELQSSPGGTHGTAATPCTVPGGSKPCPARVWTFPGAATVLCPNPLIPSVTLLGSVPGDSLGTVTVSPSPTPSWGHAAPVPWQCLPAPAS